MIALLSATGPATSAPAATSPTVGAATEGEAATQEDAAERSVFPAVLTPGLQATVKSAHNERIAEVSVRVGDRVEKGDLLLRFVDDQERVEVELATARRDRARASHERIERLHARDQVSDDQLERTATELRLAESELQLARIAMDELSLEAPFDGVVAKRFVDPGASVEVGEPLVKVTSLSLLRVEAVLPEEMLSLLSEPTEIDVHLEAPETTLTIPYRPGNLVVDPASGTFLLQLEVDNADGRLIPGVSCQISIPGARTASR